MTSTPEQETTSTTPTLSFLNYVPMHTNLKANHLKKRTLALTTLIKAEEEVEEFIHTALYGNNSQNGASAPKRVNIDLKKDCETRLHKLEKLTNRAIRELAETLRSSKE